jgi:aminocarboxymuconate-semialdehyde decarboxylase
MNLIDIHAHVVFEETLNSLDQEGPEIGGGKDHPWFRAGGYKLEGVRYRGTPFMDINLRLDAMESLGVDYQVLSPNPITYFHFIESNLAIPYCQLHNDTMAKTVSNHKQLGGFASLPMQDADAACKELERSVKELGLLGAYIGTDFPLGLSHQSLDCFYETCVNLNVPLFIHPAPQGVNGPYGDDRLNDFSLDLTVGFANDETAALGNLIFGGVLHRHPELDICISHGGGNVPFLAGRMALAAENRHTSPDWIREKGEFLRNLKLIWFDNHVHQKASLDLLETIVGNERQVLGTNFLGWDQPDRTSLKSTSAFLSENAKKLLRLTNL